MLYYLKQKIFFPHIFSIPNLLHNQTMSLKGVALKMSYTKIQYGIPISNKIFLHKSN